MQLISWSTFKSELFSFTGNLFCTFCTLSHTTYENQTGPETHTRSEMICPGTSKLACWRVQLSTASKVGRRGAGTATASIEASLLAGNINHPPAQMVPFMLADELCRPPA
jgi:hypothetical protein